jgi:hypothetical protein
VCYEARVTTTQRIAFSELDSKSKHALVEELAAWAPTVFDVDGDSLRRYWLESRPRTNIIYTMRGDDGGLVGQATLKFFDVDHQGEHIVVAKLGLGVSPEYRGSKFALRCLLQEMVRFRLANPRTPLWLFSTLIHPVTYKLCCDALGDDLYPHFARPLDAQRERMVEDLAQRFGVEKSDAPSPFVYREVFTARENRSTTSYWLDNPRPEVQFFVKHCPRYYDSSDCLIVLSPVKVGRTCARMLRTLARDTADKVTGRKHRFS